MNTHATDTEFRASNFISSALEDNSAIQSNPPEMQDITMHDITTITGASSPPAQASTTATVRWPPRKYWVQLAAQIHSKITHDWVPHAFSEREVRDSRALTHKFVSIIRVMENQQARIGGSMVDLRVDQALFIKRVEYRTTFYRIFRINDLPVEILNNIFSFVCWEAPDNRSGIKWRLYLTSICRHWRAVAINYATLWNAIWVTDGPHFQQTFTWLDRAGLSNIDIRLNDTPQKPLTLEDAQRLTEHIIPKISHIRSFVMVAQDWDPILCFIDAFRRVAGENLPMIIRAFEVHRGGSVYAHSGTGYDQSFYDNPISLFGGAIVSSLRHLCCNGVHIDWEGTHISDLLTLDIRRMPLEKAPTLAQFRNILRTSPELNKLLLDAAGPQQIKIFQTAKVDPIPLPKLQILILGDYYVDYAVYALSQITCPGVIDLTVMGLFGENLSPFFELLMAKAVVPKTLTLLHSNPISPLSIESIVKWLGSLKELSFLRISDIHKTFFDLFSYNPETMLPANGVNERTLFPKLAYLEIHSIDTDWVSHWVDKRASLGLSLKKIYIGQVFYQSLSKEKFDNLAKLNQRYQDLTLCILPRHQKAPEDVQQRQL